MERRIIEKTKKMEIRFVLTFFSLPELSVSGAEAVMWTHCAETKNMGPSLFILNKAGKKSEEKMKTQKPINEKRQQHFIN